MARGPPRANRLGGLASEYRRIRLVLMRIRSISRRTTLLLLASLPLTMAASCPTPTPTERPGSDFDGSAHWALALAQPDITSFAGDARPYTVLGSMIYRDGRLSADTGTWSIVAWSPSRQEVLQVNVQHDGSTSTTTRAQASAPSHNGQPIPAGWANSTVIFDAVAPHLASGTNHAVLAVLNTTSYPPAPTETVWGINFNVGPNQLVRVDGTYLGPQ